MSKRKEAKSHRLLIVTAHNQRIINTFKQVFVQSKKGVDKTVIEDLRAVSIIKRRCYYDLAWCRKMEREIVHEVKRRGWSTLQLSFYYVQTLTNVSVSFGLWRRCSNTSRYFALNKNSASLCSSLYF